MSAPHLNRPAIGRWLPALAAAALLMHAAQAGAACSAYLGKVVINEVYRPASGSAFVEIKALDPEVVAATGNFSGWKLAVYGGSFANKGEANVGAAFTTLTSNSCGQHSAWIKLPDSLFGGRIDAGPPLNLVLFETAGSQIVDILRIGHPATSYYGAGSAYAACSTIEDALPASATAVSQYDAISGGGFSIKDYYRNPDGTGAWSGTSTSDISNTACGNNVSGSGLSLSKIPSATSVAVNTAFTYTIYLQNGATAAAISTPAVTDSLPVGLSFVGGTPCTASAGTVSLAAGTLTWTPGASIPADYSASAVCTVQGTIAGTYTNTVAISEAGGTLTTSSAVPVTITGGAFDHLQIEHGSGQGVTCSPSILTIKACADAACSTLYGGGVSGTLTATGSPTVNWDGSTGGAGGADFVIAAGSSSVTKSVQVATPGSVVFGVAATPSPAPANSAGCNFGSPSCTFTATDAGFLFDVPNHVAEVAQTVNISAVKKSDSSLACTPAFASVTKAVTFTCSYVNPATGTLPVRVAGAALNSSNNTASACDGTGRAVNLAFGASGVASTSVQYADVGNMQLDARYAPATGSDAGLVMSGSDTFIAAPATFAFSAITPAPIKAGNNFDATVTTHNNAGAATPNFGKETPAEGVTLSFTKYQPTGAGAVNGSFSGTVGTFSGGAASGSNLSWSEVGSIDLSATLASASYLGSGLTASGTTGVSGAVGRFIPDHFDTAVTQGCNSGGFTYSGQPFTVTVTARNGAATPATTRNYDGTASTTPNFSQAVTLADANAVAGGSLAPASVAASAFAAGVASATPAFTFTRTVPDKAPATIKLRAVDADGVTSAGASEGTAAIRIGRLTLSNAFGSEKSALQVSLQAQYWSGNSWVLNASDACTAIPAASVALSNYLDNHGAATTAWSTSVGGAVALSGGQGTLTLSAPAPTATGSVDLALNLGTGTQDTSCLATHPTMAAPLISLAYLRGKNGSCAASATYSADPSARATFGVYAAEKRKAVHIRELY